MSAAAIADVRRAALMLHAMEPTDRSWLLTQLPPAQQGQIGEALDELRELGIPRESRLLRQVIDSAAVPARPADDLSYMQTLGALQCTELAAVLAAEPQSLAATLLRIHPWTWSQAVVAQLPAGFAVLPPATEIGGALSALDLALLAQLRRRLSAAATSARAARRSWRRASWRRHAA